MAWRFVRQPNGLLARWSDIVDHFTHYNYTPEEAETLCVEELNCGRVTAKEKIRRALEDQVLEDQDPYTMKPGSGLDRWNDCLHRIEARHGVAARLEAERIGSYDDA